MKILSGIQPSGTPHIGNYFGMMKPAIELQEQGETLLFIADYHSLTLKPNPEDLQKNIMQVALDFLACGINPEKTVFFRQSDVPQVTELAWILSPQVPNGLLERCHSYKDKIAKGFTPNNALFSYPILMAADILIYQSDIVPVGRDQKQHLEVARDIAIKFNNHYGDVFTIPKEQIKDSVAVIPGIDGQKMSKSYNNTIELFNSQKPTRKKIMKIVTDSQGVDDPKDPTKCNVFALYKLFSNEQQQYILSNKYKNTKGFGYGHAKQELFEMMWEYFVPFRKRREELEKDLGFVHNVLNEGGKKAAEIAENTMTKVRKIVGLRA